MTDLSPTCQFETAPRSSFRRHPLVENIAMLPQCSEAFLRICESIKNEGIREPLKCVIEGDKLLVVDGIHRLTIAEELQIPDLPYVEVKAEEALNAVCSSLVRADWSKSALAYRMWALFEACCFKKGGNRKSNRNDCALISIREIAEKLAISERLVDQAKRLHAYFAKNPEAREQQECAILIGTLPLHRAGVEAKSPSLDIVPIRGIETHLSKLPKRFERWHQVSHEDRERAKNTLASVLHQLPKDVQETAFDALEVSLGR